MLVNKEDIEKLAKQIRYDMSVTKTRLDQLTQMVASLPMPAAADAITCPRGCGTLSTLTNERQLAHHMEYVHGEFDA